MTMSTPQLSEDYVHLKNFLERHPNIRLLQAVGHPPDTYEIEYALRGYIHDATNTISIGTTHRIHIKLPFGYPHFPPLAKPITPVFHPDFDPTAIRIAEQWQKNPSLPDLIFHIGEMICGKSYNVVDPFNQEAVEWYRHHADQLPLDTIETLAFQATAPQPDIPDSFDVPEEGIFASLGLEADVLPLPEAKIDPLESDRIRELIAQQRIFTANKILSDLPPNASFPDREELQQEIGKILRKTDQLFKLAEQLEDMAKYTEALEVTDNLLAIAVDAPGVDALRDRIRQSSHTARELESLADEGLPPDDAFIVHPPPAQTESAPPAPRRRIQVNLVAWMQRSIPLKPILLGLLFLSLCTGIFSLYIKDQNTISLSQDLLCKGRTLIAGKQFDAALNALESARQSLFSLSILRFRKSHLEQEILHLIASRDLQEGLKGQVLHEGTYIPVEMAAALKELTILIEQGQALAGRNKISEALALYRQAEHHAAAHHLLNQQESIKESIQSLELQQTLSVAELAEHNNDWEQAAGAYRKALSLSSNIQTLGTTSEITHRLTAATFRHDLDQSKKAFTQSRWQETIRILEQAQQVINANPNVVSGQERRDLHNLLINARLYLILSTARTAYEEKNWDKAVQEYQNALELLNSEPNTSAKDLVGDSVEKIERTLLLVQIAHLQEKVLTAERSGDGAAIVAHSRHIQRLIQANRFADDPAIKTISRQVGEKIDKQQKILSQNEKIQWLEEHFEEIFRTHYPAFRGATRMNPKAVFKKNVGSNSVFLLTCIEKSQGASAKLELTYMYDSATEKWSVFNE